ncbi:Hydrogenase-4 component B [Sporomusa silvacetica DSM 10669]|uniref:Hydrogenase-4 component B n=1 Tax=Sporomusa silvacetica DSM 10669 TaxID=1123289 RepID=A0ABZ3IJQ3_9FIRM|nr:hydrogenase 4 subunit B [Sporomusa silvacetica]OZC18700.1 hydrogenase-4 component B [Sporomusa silvacetica DSM 10669]
MIVELLLYFLMVFFIIGVLSPFLTGKNKIVNYVAHGMAALGCLAAVLCAIIIFNNGKIELITPLTMFAEPVYIRLDYLAAYFLLIIGVVGCAASVYAVGYSKEYLGDGCGYRVMASLYNAFLLSMILVVCVSHIAAFVIVWELMALTSFLLVNYEHKKHDARKAAFIYIVMTHVGTAFIITAFFLLANKAGSLDFLRLMQTAGTLDTWTRNAVFLCALIGFGAKAGIIPLHIWLPRAHPAAPSHVSALMSGVMIKTAIYGLCRFYLGFLGTGSVWWGAVILVLAIVSSVLGVLYALMEHDIKRLLAYSSVENIGIILLGMGAGLVFSAKGYGGLAALAWVAALYHALNHAIFKSLLFMGAGAVLQSTHTKDIERLGGLIRKMPYTAVWFLAGAAAISALPPFNGFVSEWMTFQALFYLPQSMAGALGKLFSAFLLALLGLTGALAAACFVKAFGIVFLAKPRSVQAEQAKEVNKFMLVSMAMLSGLCLVLGLWSEPVIHILKQVLSGVAGVDPAQAFNGTTWYAAEVHTGVANGSLQMPVVAVLLLVGAMVAWLLYRLCGREQVHEGETWTCGNVPTARMEYTATGFSKPIRLAFKAILRPQHETIADLTPNRYFGRRLSYHMSIVDIFSAIYRPINSEIIHAAQFMKAIQAGSVQLYIGYITVITVIALILSTGW